MAGEIRKGNEAAHAKRNSGNDRDLERVKGIEPSSQAWEARILPLNHTRIRCSFI